MHGNFTENKIDRVVKHEKVEFVKAVYKTTFVLLRPSLI